MAKKRDLAGNIERESMLLYTASSTRTKYETWTFCLFNFSCRK